MQPLVMTNFHLWPQFLSTHILQAFVHVWENYREEADWFIKADDDTYVIMENLKWVLFKNSMWSLLLQRSFEELQQQNANPFRSQIQVSRGRSRHLSWKWTNFSGIHGWRVWICPLKGIQKFLNPWHSDFYKKKPFSPILFPGCSWNVCGGGESKKSLPGRGF